MEILYSKRFLKDLSKIPSKQRKPIELFVFDYLPGINVLGDITNLKKLKGYNTYYRVRFNNFRVGIEYEDGKLTLKRVLDRKNIYKYFP